MCETTAPKVCFVVPMPPPYGGIANWSRLTTSELERRGLPFEVVNTAPRRRSVDGRSAYERFIVSGVDIFRVAAAMRRAIRGGCGVVHLTTSGEYAIVRDIALLWLAKLMRTPTVYHVRFGRVPQMREQGTREWRWFRRAASLANITLAIDQSTFRSLVEEFDAGRVACIPNPVDPRSLPPVAPDSERTVVYLGWVIPSKGIGELLTAWGEFFEAHSEWTLKLIGPASDSYRSHLLETLNVDGVEFCGEFDHDVAMSDLARCGIFILPSHTEGFPNVLLEAMALGRASIATSVGAIPEMLSGGCGRIVSPHNSAELLEALLEVSESEALRSGMGHQSRQKVRDEYCLDAVLAQYGQLWARVA